MSTVTDRRQFHGTLLGEMEMIAVGTFAFQQLSVRDTIINKFQITGVIGLRMFDVAFMLSHFIHGRANGTLAMDVPS